MNQENVIRLSEARLRKQLEKRMLDPELAERITTSEVQNFVHDVMVASLWKLSGGMVGIVSRLISDAERMRLGTGSRAQTRSGTNRGQYRSSKGTGKRHSPEPR
jgi:hypothetical protein